MKQERIDAGQAFDFGKTAAFYARFRDIYPAALFQKLRAFGVAAPGTDWLDLGTGTGVLPKNLYRSDVRITGVDLSQEQIRFAKRQAADAGLQITYLARPAENTGLPDHSFDCITAAQCFWYFDKETVAAEIRRLLKPGGIFIKVYMDFDYHNPVAKSSISLVQEFNPNWSPQSTGAEDVFDDLFPGRVTEVFEEALPFTRESWHGRMLACRGTLASMEKTALREWERRHLQMMQACPPSFTVHHKIFVSRFILP